MVNCFIERLGEIDVSFTYIVLAVNIVLKHLSIKQRKRTSFSLSFLIPKRKYNT